jgi:hypothetical protein
MVDPPKLVGNLDQAQLGKVPYVRRKLTRYAWAAPHAFDMLVEILVDTVDEDRHRRVNRSQAWGQVTVSVTGAALKVARWKIQKPDEVIDHAVQLFIGDQARQPWVDLEPIDLVEMFEDGHRNGGEPHLGPRKRRRRKEGEGLLAEDLVADQLVEEVAGGKTCGPSSALVQDALGLEQQGLAESLRSDDDELVVPVQAQEVVDLGRAVQQSLVEVFGDADVVGIHGPRSHALLLKLARSK